MNSSHSPRENHLISPLPVAEYDRICPHLELVAMPRGKVLYESGDDLSYAFFPTSCVIALQYITADGNSTQLAMVGNEGIVGIELFMAGGSMPSGAVVQVEGCGYRLRASWIRRESSTSGPLFHFLLRYTQALITQLAQTAVCNRYHSVDQQLCRFLLLSLDRVMGNELVVTHELISKMLGVRREGVTQAAGNLQKAGLIDCRRGHVTVLDRPGIEARVCECYHVVKTEFDRLIPQSSARHPIEPIVAATREMHVPFGATQFEQRSRL